VDLGASYGIYLTDRYNDTKLLASTGDWYSASTRCLDQKLPDCAQTLNRDSDEREADPTVSTGEPLSDFQRVKKCPAHIERHSALTRTSLEELTALARVSVGGDDRKEAHLISSTHMSNTDQRDSGEVLPLC